MLAGWMIGEGLVVIGIGAGGARAIGGGGRLAGGRAIDRWSAGWSASARWRWSVASGEWWWMR